MVAVRRGGGLGPVFSDGPIRQGLLLARFWVATWCCEGSRCSDPAGSAPGNAEFDLVATPGRRPRIWRNVEVCGRSSLARVARATRRLGRAALQLVCGFGAEWCTSGRRPRVWWCVLWRSVGLRRVGDDPLACVVFLSCFPHKQDICMVFGPGFCYKPGKFFFYTNCRNAVGGVPPGRVTIHA